MLYILITWKIYIRVQHLNIFFVEFEIIVWIIIRRLFLPRHVAFVVCSHVHSIVRRPRAL